MKLDIKERKKNALMKREEALISIEHGGKATPARKHILDEVAKLLNAKPEGIIINRIITRGGKARSEANVFAYPKKEDVPAWRLKKMEYRLSRTKSAEESKDAGEAAGPGNGPKETGDAQAAPKEEKKEQAAPEENATESGESENTDTPREDANKEAQAD